MFITNSIIDNMFESTMDNFLSKGTTAAAVENTDSGKRIYVELPGVNKKDIKISTNNNVLSISAERKGYLKSKFEKNFVLPIGMGIDETQAEFLDGLLTIHVPFSSKKNHKNIEIS